MTTEEMETLASPKGADVEKGQEGGILDIDGKREKKKSKKRSAPALDSQEETCINAGCKSTVHSEAYPFALLYLVVIAKSTSLLSPVDVLKLLKSLTSMVQQRGAVLICALPWLRSLLCQQASGIASQESSLHIPNSLYQLIEARVSTFRSALQLSTSLDVLCARMPEVETEEDSTIPLIIYEDKDSSDEEEENEDAMETDEDDGQAENNLFLRNSCRKHYNSITKLNK
ncbi:uncharacterized protein A4U43_C08F7120 [Asparagus officinalis]|nr:uncharacterized protein A4U43_C08F7120 [Asparagus officinalis]